MLSQLVYSSERRDLGAGGIIELLGQARAINAELGITGALLVNRHFFLQCLEGDRRRVTSTFARIISDRRHDNLALISVRDLDERDFPDWTMGLMTATDAMKPTFREFLPADDFSPVLLSGQSAVALLKTLRQMQYTV